MTRDPLDELLEASRPRAAEHDPSLDALLRQMVRDAREAVPKAPRRRRRNIGIAAALAGVLVVGGGGVAIASGLVAWPSGYEAPDTAFAFTLPSGRACEVRLVIGARIEGREQSAIADDTAQSPEVQRAQEEIARWLHGSDPFATLDLAAAEKQAAEILDVQRAAGMTILIGKDGWLTDANIASHREADADDAYAFAVDRALRTAWQEHLRSADLPESANTVASAGGVKCAAE